MDRVLGGLGLWIAGMGGGLMRGLLALIASVFLLGFQAVPAKAGMLKVPSGQLVLPYEFLWEDHVNEGEQGEAWLILRFLTPDIARDKGKMSFGDAEPDLEFLCREVGLPLVKNTGPVHQIIVNLMDQPIARGARNADVTQFISAYRVTTAGCEWEL